MPPVQKLVLVAIANYAYKQADSSRVSIGKLAKMVGLTPRMIRYHLSALEDKGLVRRVAAQGQINTFLLNREVEKDLGLEGDPCNPLHGGDATHCSGGVQPISPNPAFDPVIDPDRAIRADSISEISGVDSENSFGERRKTRGRRKEDALAELGAVVLTSAVQQIELNCTGNLTMPTVEEKLAAFKATGSTGHKKPSAPKGVTALADKWRELLLANFTAVSFVAPLTTAQLGQLRHVIKRTPAGLAEPVLTYALEHWSAVKAKLESTFGVFPVPSVPSVGFVLKNIEALTNLYQKSLEKAPSVPLKTFDAAKPSQGLPAPEKAATAATQASGGIATVEELEALLNNLSGKP